MKTSYPCIGCGRQLRPSRKTVAELPGTLRDHGGHRCTKCWYAQEGKVRKSRAKPQSKLPRCKRCSQRMRGAKVPLEDMPDTVQHKSGGYCTTCASELRGLGVKVEERQKMPPQCVRCLRPLRRSHEKLADHPWTVRFAGKGLCITCHTAAARGNVYGKAAREAVRIAPEAAGTEDAKNLERFLAARHARQRGVRKITRR